MAFKKRLTSKQYAAYIYNLYPEKYNKLFEAFGYNYLQKSQKIAILGRLFYNFWSKSIKIARKGHPINYFTLKTKHRGEHFYFWMGIGNKRRIFFHNKKRSNENT